MHSHLGAFPTGKLTSIPDQCFPEALPTILGEYSNAVDLEGFRVNQLDDRIGGEGLCEEAVSNDFGISYRCHISKEVDITGPDNPALGHHVSDNVHDELRCGQL